MVDDPTTSEQLMAAESDSEADVRVGGDNGCPRTLVEPDLEPEEDWATFFARVMPPDIFTVRF